jgi:hypothetical protein
VYVLSGFIGLKGQQRYVCTLVRISRAERVDMVQRFSTLEAGVACIEAPKLKYNPNNPDNPSSSNNPSNPVVLINSPSNGMYNLHNNPY